MVVVKKNNPSTFGASLDPLRASEHVKKTASDLSKSNKKICLKEEHGVQLCPGVHSGHSLMDTRVGPIEHSQMDPTEGSREGGTLRPTVPWRPFRAVPDGHQCPGVHSEHSLMDTRVGPIEPSQMDPTEGSREGGAWRPTLPWRPFRAFPDGHQGRAHRAFSNEPHRKMQEHKTHNGICTGSHFQAFPGFSRVWWCGKSKTLGRGQIVHYTALR